MLIGLVIIDPFAALIQDYSVSTDLGRQLANAHILFNIGGVVLFAPFLTFLEVRLRRWV